MLGVFTNYLAQPLGTYLGEVTDHHASHQSAQPGEVSEPLQQHARRPRGLGQRRAAVELGGPQHATPRAMAPAQHLCA